MDVRDRLRKPCTPMRHHSSMQSMRITWSDLRRNLSSLEKFGVQSAQELAVRLLVAVPHGQ